MMARRFEHGSLVTWVSMGLGRRFGRRRYIREYPSISEYRLGKPNIYVDYTPSDLRIPDPDEVPGWVLVEHTKHLLMGDA